MFIVWRRRNALIPTLVAWQDVIQIKLLPSLEIRGRVIEPYNAIILVFHAPDRIGTASLLQRETVSTICLYNARRSLLDLLLRKQKHGGLQKGLGLSGRRTRLD